MKSSLGCITISVFSLFHPPGVQDQGSLTATAHTLRVTTTHGPWPLCATDTVLSTSMGRLVDSILAAMGVKPSDHVSKVPSPDTRPDTTTNISGLQQPQERNVSETEPGVAQDCTGCKVVGVGMCYGSGIWVMSTTLKKIPAAYTGWRRGLLKFYGVWMASSLFALGTWRLFEWGPFDKRNASIPLPEQLKGETRTLLTFIGVQKIPNFLEQNLEDGSHKKNS